MKMGIECCNCEWQALLSVEGENIETVSRRELAEALNKIEVARALHVLECEGRQSPFRKNQPAVRLKPPKFQAIEIVNDEKVVIGVPREHASDVAD